VSAVLYDNVTVTVEIGFSTTGGANKVPLNGALTDIVWTDVTAFVRSVDTKRGRNNELDDFSTGTAQLVLSNADRRFDPEYSAGPYYGAVTPGRALRIRGSYNGGTTYGIFFGWIDGWQQDYTQPNDATVSIVASDAFKILNQLVLPGFYNNYVDALESTMKARFKLDEVSNSPSAVDTKGTYGALPWIASGTSTTTRGVAYSPILSSVITGDSFVDESSLIAPVLDADIGIDINGPVTGNSPFFGATGTTSASLWFSTSSTTAGNYGLINLNFLTNNYVVGMIVTGNIGTIKIYRWGAAGTDIWTSQITVNDGQPHLLAMPAQSALSASPPSIDGVAMTSAGTDTINVSTVFQIGFASATSFVTSGTFSLSNSWTGRISDFILWTSTPSFLDLYNVGVGNYGAGDLAGTRATTVLNIGEWITDARNILSTTSTLSGTTTLNQNFLDALKTIEEAEQGRLFVDGSGRLTLIGRNTIFTTAAYADSQATFGDGAGELPYSDLTFSYDDRLIKNSSTVSRKDGNSFTANDTSSQNEYFVRAESLSNLIVDNDDFAEQVAKYRVNFYKQPALRVESIDVQPRKDPANLFAKVLSYDVGTRITVKRRPQNVGTAISKDLLIEGISHRITLDDWVTTWTLSPTPVDAFILDSATKGVLDTNRLGL